MFGFLGEAKSLATVWPSAMAVNNRGNSSVAFDQRRSDKIAKPPGCVVILNGRYYCYGTCEEAVVRAQEKA